MTSEVGERAKQRAEEARQRAREAGRRAAELASGTTNHGADAVQRSQEAVDRAAHLAREGYRHAAAAELAAGQAHDTVAKSLEQRAARNPTDEVALLQEAVKHRNEAREHRRKAAIDAAALTALESRDRQASSDPA